MGEGGHACKLALKARKQWPDEGLLAPSGNIRRGLIAVQKIVEVSLIFDILD